MHWDFVSVELLKNTRSTGVNHNVKAQIDVFLASTLIIRDTLWDSSATFKPKNVDLVIYLLQNDEPPSSSKSNPSNPGLNSSF